MKFPAEALVFEAMQDGDDMVVGDMSKKGEVYEFVEPAYASYCIRAKLAYSVLIDGEPYTVLDVRNLKPLTPAAKLLLANLPTQLGESADNWMRVATS